MSEILTRSCFLLNTGLGGVVENRFEFLWDRDIRIIGVNINVGGPSTTGGHVWVQKGKLINADVSMSTVNIFDVEAWCYVITSGAQPVVNETMMLPEGSYIEIKEGQPVLVHCENLSGVDTMPTRVTIYYYEA